MKTYKVNSIYAAYMGEVNKFGIGAPCVFVRLQGCNIRCYFGNGLCDTPEGLESTGGKELNPQEIIEEVRRVSKLYNPLVCLTGGEPLMQDVTELLTEMSKAGFNVVVETNGTKDFRKYQYINNVSWVVDVKSPSTGVDSKLINMNMLSSLREGDFVKFVIKTEEDMQHFIKFAEHINSFMFRATVSVGLYWSLEKDKITYKSLRETVLNCFPEAYLNCQNHKLQELYDHVEDEPDLKIPTNI